MRQDTDAPEGANDDGVSLTDSVDDGDGHEMKRGEE